jgi:circadian clock protein KaiB
MNDSMDIDQGAEKWDFRLYVAGKTPKSLAAYANLKKLCDEHLPDRYTIEVIDLQENPQLAQNDQILAIPTVVRKLPSPICRLVGDLRDKDRAIVGLQLHLRDA